MADSKVAWGGAEVVEALRAALASFPAGVWLVDHAGVTVYANQAFERMVGVSAEALIGVDRAQILGVSEGSGARKLLRASGPDVWVRLVESPFLAPSGTPAGTLALVMDITEARATERTNVEALARAQQELAERGELLSVLSHELRTPLNTIVLETEFVSGRIHSHPQALRAVAKITRQTRRLQRLVSNLLAAARVDMGRTGPWAPCSLVAVVHDARSMLASEADHEGVVVSVDAPVDVTGQWDPEALSQVVGNLLANAIRHGGGAVRVSVTTEGAFAKLIVSDRGKGVAAADRERIFHAFERGPTAAAGVGLGLWIVQRALSALGGKISVDDAEGGGARFVALLPRA